MARRNLAQVASWLGNIRARTWLILGGLAFAVFGLLVWAGIALLSWLWAQAPAVTEAGKRLAGETATKIEQAAPELKEQAQQWVPGLKEQAEQWLPAEVKEQAGKWLPGLGADLPASDVSGTDIGPVPRFPGLVRGQFARAEQSVEARYVGRAAFDAVLMHYIQGFADAGFAQEVVSATPEEERHRFRRDRESIDFALMRRPGGAVEVLLRQASSPSE